jgi:protein-L-isoaspartate O-methyltransferase
MQDSIQQHYESNPYPAMSHPLSDPAVSAVAARIGGLKTAHPAKARILEIGCCSGHNLIPLAIRWPGSECIGIDLAASSIQAAGSRALAAGLENVVFQVADLRSFQPQGGPFNFIIAHGFFSWVPDEVKAALLVFCRENLAKNGIATISFNLESGWRSRMPVIGKTRAIQQLKGCDVIVALEILRSITEPESPDLGIIDDMIAKGSAVLMCDDFGPVNDPWSLGRFVQSAGNAGLRWLGESAPAENFPDSLSDEVIQNLAETIPNPLALQAAADELAVRTFRSGVLCRVDAPVDDAIHLGMIFDFAVKAGRAPSESQSLEVWQALTEFGPACVPMSELTGRLPAWDLRPLAAKVFEGITRGWILPRIEPVIYETEVSEFPCLSAFRLDCARSRLPLVDA